MRLRAAELEEAAAAATPQRRGAVAVPHYLVAGAAEKLDNKADPPPQLAAAAGPQQPLGADAVLHCLVAGAATAPRPAEVSPQLAASAGTVAAPHFLVAGAAPEKLDEAELLPQLTAALGKLDEVERLPQAEAR